MIETPEQFAKRYKSLMSVVVAHQGRILQEYRWAYGAAHERAVRDTAGRRSGTSDPTAEVVGDPLDHERTSPQVSIRKVLRGLPKRLTKIEEELKAIDSEIARAMDRLSPREGFEPNRYPRIASNADLEESKLAQERRWGRGEGIA